MYHIITYKNADGDVIEQEVVEGDYIAAFHYVYVFGKVVGADGDVEIAAANIDGN